MKFLYFFFSYQNFKSKNLHDDDEYLFFFSLSLFKKKKRKKWEIIVKKKGAFRFLQEKERF